MKQDIILLCKTCPSCQLLKRPTKKYSHAPVKDAECIPWHTLAVDLVGPYQDTSKNKKKLTFDAISMIHLATGFLKLHSVDI